MEFQVHSNLTMRVASALGRSIAVGEYPTGTTLPAESVLTAEFGTSRTVLREAVKMLTAKGLLDARPRRGTIVKPETEWNLADPDILSWLLHRKNVLPLILEFAEVRLAIEPAAAALAARRADADAITEMHNAIAQMRDSVTGDADPLSSDIAFHVALLKSSGNRFFWSLRFMVEVALRFSIRVTDQRTEDKRANVEDHNRILEAIIAGDQQTAEASMRSLILEAKTLLYEAQARHATNASAELLAENGLEVAGRGDDV